MLRSAALAVLAIALSSSSAAAQSAEPDLEIDIMSMLDYERDLHSTFSALDRGFVEGNPVLGDGNRVKLVGAKLAASTAAIFISEKLWKSRRRDRRDAGLEYRAVPGRRAQLPLQSRALGWLRLLLGGAEGALDRPHQAGRAADVVELFEQLNRF